jgi:hypothetical protein
VTIATARGYYSHRLPSPSRMARASPPAVSRRGWLGDHPVSQVIGNARPSHRSDRIPTLRPYRCRSGAWASSFRGTCGQGFRTRGAYDRSVAGHRASPLLAAGSASRMPSHSQRRWRRAGLGRMCCSRSPDVGSFAGASSMV